MLSTDAAAGPRDDADPILADVRIHLTDYTIWRGDERQAQLSAGRRASLQPGSIEVTMASATKRSDASRTRTSLTWIRPPGLMQTPVAVRSVVAAAR